MNVAIFNLRVVYERMPKKPNPVQATEGQQ